MKLFSILVFQIVLSKSSWAAKFDLDHTAVENVEITAKGKLNAVKIDSSCTLPLCFLLGNYKVSGNLTDLNLVSEKLKDETTTLKSHPTINEAVLSSRKGVQLPNKKDLPGFLKSENELITELPVGGETRKKLRANVLEAITRTLKFYGSELDQIKTTDSAFALVVLKEVDSKHKATLQKEFPLDYWAERICEQAGNECSVVGNSCKSLTRQWKTRPGSGMGYWKMESILNTYLNKSSDLTLEKIGNENEEVWPVLIGQCQMALFPRCELPYVCERTLLDPTPRSQYLLTHQLLQRIFIGNADCPSNPAIKSFVTEEKTYNDFCAKVLLETKYLDVLDVPHLYRDLFSEMVGLCGYMGYTNFLREDWLNRILSWQSKSESGCFVKSSQFPVNYIQTDIGFGRKPTKQELEQHIQPNEECLPHFTATSLMALTTYYDYLMDS